MENINRREKFHRMNPQRGWPFPCRIYFFSSFILISSTPGINWFSIRFLFVQLQTYSWNNSIYHNQVDDAGTTGDARSLYRPPTFPVECLEIKLIVVIKLLETYRSGPAPLVNHPSVQLAEPFVMQSSSKRLEKMSIHQRRNKVISLCRGYTRRLVYS